MNSDLTIDGEDLVPVPFAPRYFVTRDGRVFSARRDNVSRTRTGKWRARICRSGEVTLVGIYADRDEAVRAMRAWLESQGKHPLVYEMRGYVGRDGYRRVTLRVDGESVNYTAHRLIAETLIPNPDSLPVVRHLDDNGSNNHVDNLVWGSHLDNELDKRVNWLLSIGRERAMRIFDIASGNSTPLANRIAREG